MGDKINDLLSLAADMESCVPSDDKLSDLIHSYDDDELSENDLLFVAAAGSSNSYEAFRKRFHLDSGK